MKVQVELNNLVTNDRLIRSDCLYYVQNLKDPLHILRKKQQRAISDEMILIAIFYGLKKRTYQDWSYTITDRSLRGTPYEKFLDRLRGLTVIGNWEDKEFHMITSYWDFIVKQRKRY